MFFNKKLLIGISYVALFIAAGCHMSGNGEPSRHVVGGICYGGLLTINEQDDFRSLDPRDLTDVTAFHIAGQIYEGLVKPDPRTLDVIPCLAKSWEISEDYKTYTFHLRQGVHFQDDPCFKDGVGREVTADDFKYCFDRLCTASPGNQLYPFAIGHIAGAREYYTATQIGAAPPSGVTGVKALDTYTLQIKLAEPFPGFLKLLTHSSFWVYPHEMVEDSAIDQTVYAVGTGPFRIKKITQGSSAILVRNPNYWRKDSVGNPLPYLDGIKFTFIKNKKKELQLFYGGILDVCSEVPAWDAKNVDTSQYVVQSTPAMSLQYYGFQHISKLFGDVRVRKAFNYAINRQFIVDSILHGGGVPATHGIVPPSFSDYPINNVKGYSFHPDSARKLMKQAGYPMGKGFPVITLQFNDQGGANLKVAEAVQNMLKQNIGVITELSMVPKTQHYERVETGKALFWRDGWVADYPDPENFLKLLYGKDVSTDLNQPEYLNSVRYKSEKFDSLFDVANTIPDKSQRMKVFSQADQVAMNDAAIMPLYYDVWYRLESKKLAQYYLNPMNYRDFSQTYFKCSEEKL